MNIPTLAIFFACTVWCGGIRAQSSSRPLPQPEKPAQPAPAPDSADMQTDRFTDPKEAADLRRAAYAEVDKRNMAEIDKLMRTKKCQINRIAPLLDDTIVAMNDWLVAERKYWDLWNEAEERRVEDLQRTQAGLEADAERTAKMVDIEAEGFQELQRQRAILEADTRTAEIVARIDGVIKDIRDTEARLENARQQQESVNARLRDLKASLSTRLISIRENKVRLDAWQVDQSAYYAERRTSANDVCQAARPAESIVPAPSIQVGPKKNISPAPRPAAPTIPPAKPKAEK